MRRDSLFTIAPDQPFLETLVARVLDGTLLGDWPRQGAFWLADITIILPTRRSRLKLAEAFARALGGTALLPDIRTFGGEAADEEPFLPPFEAEAPLAPVGRIERTLTLARLVDAWARTPDGREVLATPPNAAEILGLADSLGTLLDDLSIEGITPSAIAALPPEHLAENWRQTLQFLNIALRAWPELLAAAGRADSSTLRNDRLLRQAATAPLLYGDRPVIAAGSTGSIPATAALLSAIAGLPRGVLVLPGLDTTLSGEAHERLIDHGRSAHGHPQYGLARLLRRLGTTHAAVTELAGTATPRVRLVRRALDAAEATGDWAVARAELQPELAAALEGLTTLAARTEEEEARAIAIAARGALAKGQTVGIISPDQTLARRIAAELARFDIVVDDAAGTPLFQSPAGRLARLVLAVAVSDCAAVDLMALLKNRAAALGLDRSETARLAGLIDMRLLRGQRPAAGVAGLRAALLANMEGVGKPPPRRILGDDATALLTLFDRLETALKPLADALGSGALTARDLADALSRSVDAVTATPEGSSDAALPGKKEFDAWSAALVESGEAGPRFAPVALDAVLAALMAGSTVTSPTPSRGDIEIWGRLEARLMAPDLMILAGLNEDIWPEPADPGPWLSRGMRIAAGLEPPERQQGQAAHDFEMAIGTRNTVLAFAERRGTAPALPSRLLQRLEGFIGKDWSDELRTRGGEFVTLARRLDANGAPAKPASRPLPSPPAALRPMRLSVTEIETLFRSPYDLYAKHVLGLRKLAALGEPPDARERGSMIHEVFSGFVEDGARFDAEDAEERLNAMARAAFAGLDAIGERRDIWLRRFALAAHEFLGFERRRDARVAQRHAEIAGEWRMPSGFVLVGRADRIDRMADGSYALIDFKTGSLPAPGAMKAYDAPQMLLEAAMAQAGAFEDLPPGPVSGLTYIKIGLGPEAFIEREFALRDGMDIGDAADEAARRLQRHVDAFILSDALPLAARIRPDLTRRYAGDYDHLARVAEWIIAEGEDE